MVSTFVLIHSPLVGPMTWQLTAEVLKDHGQRVVVPSFADAIGKGPPYYERLAAEVASAIHKSGPMESAIFVAHSGAGGLVPAAIAASRVSVSAALFVDAILPHPGSSWLDTAPPPLRERIMALARDDVLPPWNKWFPQEALISLLPDENLRDSFIAELPVLPLRYFQESAPVSPRWPTARCGYLQLSSAYEQEAEEAARLGWPVRRQSVDHLAMISKPHEVAEALQLLVGIVDLR
jgi:hypothetical protein